MKFSKLIKNADKKQEMKQRRTTVLMSRIYGDIRTGSPAVNNYFTPSKKPFEADLDNTIVEKTPKASTSPLARLFEFKSTKSDAVSNAMAKQKLFECLMETPKIGHSIAITPRVVKSQKAKRLQRNKLVKAKPEAYVLRSSVIGLDRTPKQTVSNYF